MADRYINDFGDAALARRALEISKIGGPSHDECEELGIDEKMCRVLRRVGNLYSDTVSDGGIAALVIEQILRTVE